MFEFPVRVYYSDTDAEGIVYHGKYLDFAEHARTEMLRACGVSQHAMQEGGYGFVITSITIDYHRPAVLDDELVVKSEVETSRTFSMIIGQHIMRGEEELATLKVKAASIDLHTGRPVPLPKNVAEAFKKL